MTHHPFVVVFEILRPSRVTVCLSGGGLDCRDVPGLPQPINAVVVGVVSQSVRLGPKRPPVRPPLSDDEVD
jgi:hypothetical protein